MRTEELAEDAEDLNKFRVAIDRYRANRRECSDIAIFESEKSGDDACLERNCSCNFFILAFVDFSIVLFNEGGAGSCLFVLSEEDSREGQWQKFIVWDGEKVTFTV